MEKGCIEQMVVHNWEVAPKTNDYYTFCCRTSPEDIWRKTSKSGTLRRIRTTFRLKLIGRKEIV